MTTRLTTPEERVERIKNLPLGTGWAKAQKDIAQEIRQALKELVEVAWERAPVNSDDDTFIDIELLTEIVNEALPEEEKIE